MGQGLPSAWSVGLETVMGSFGRVRGGELILVHRVMRPRVGLGVGIIECGWVGLG